MGLPWRLPPRPGGLVALAVAASLGLSLHFLPVQGPTAPSWSPSFDIRGDPGRQAAADGRPPLSFEENGGRTDPRVKFLSRGDGYALYLTRSEAVLALRGTDRDRSAVLRMGLVGANPSPEMQGTDQLPGVVNSFVGADPKQRRTGIPTYAGVRYTDVYRGVDLVYYGRQGRLEYDFRLAPGSDPNDVRLRLQGADGMRVDRRGDLVLTTAAGPVRHGKPVAYQKVGRERRAVPVRYVLHGEGQVGFRVGRFDPARPLVIDPVLVYSTYLGGSNIDRGRDIAVDSLGNAYVTGDAFSTDFPTTSGSLDSAAGGGVDAFVTKLDPTGSTVLYSTYVGGDRGPDFGMDVTVDALGSLYFVGQTGSSDVPTTFDAYDPTWNGDGDAFLVKLDAAGGLLYGTYFGGADFDSGDDVVVDSLQNVYVTGETFSSDLPTTPGALDGTLGGTGDAFVMKLEIGGFDPLVFSTYLGGSRDDESDAIAVDATGSAYVTGRARSSDFPVTADAPDSSLEGGSDAFITKLDPTASTALYSTYLGGAGDDFIFDIVLDGNENTYLTGLTSSPDFPTTADAFDTSFGGVRDGFVTKLDPSGPDPPLYSTYLGGAGDDFGQDVAVDAAGNAHVTGQTWSRDFPTTSQALDCSLGGERDGFYTKLDPGGSPLDSTYLGAGGSDYGAGIALDSLGNAHIAGAAGAGFPTTPGAFDGSYAGSTDAFVVRLADGQPAQGCPPPDTTPPAPPTGLVASAGDASVELDWDDNSEGDLAGYHVYRSTTAGGPYEQVSSSPLTSSAYTDTGLSNGTTYYYVVRALDSSDNPSGDSGEASARPAGLAYRQAVLATSNLVSYWRLGESSGPVAADSKGTRNGTYFGPALGLPGALAGDPDTAAGFDGNDDYVQVADFAPPANLTLEAWVYPRPTATGREQLIFDKTNNEYGLRINTSGYLGFATGTPAQSARDEGFNFNTAANANRWYHVVASFDNAADTVRLYRDGALVKTVTGFTATIKNTSSPLRIGRHNGNFGTFDGSIDEVALYNAALSGAAVMEHYRAAGS